MNSRQMIALIAAVASVSACTGPGGRPNSGVMSGGNPNKQDVGTVIGGVAGGVLGSTVGRGGGRVAATIGGTLLGAAIGNSVGASLDRADMMYYNQASQHALESGQPGQAFPWQNPQSGNSGVITPQKYYQSSNGQYCREYQQKIVVGGQTQQAYGTACRQPDGSWQVVQQ